MPKNLYFMGGALVMLALLCAAFAFSEPPTDLGSATSSAESARRAPSYVTPAAPEHLALEYTVPPAPGSALSVAYAGTSKTAVLYDPAQDTITNAEKDTLLLPYTFLSRFTYLFSVERTQLSGTHNVKLYVEESNSPTGNTTWRIIDSTTTTTATLAHLDGDEVYGRRLRLRVSGTGTQSATYRLRGTLKYK